MSESGRPEPGGDLEPTDRELVLRLQAGDHGAFEELWRRHREWLYRQALLQARGRTAVAEEVVQDVFLSLFDGRVDPQRNVPGYLLTAVRTRTINALQRREARDDRASLEDLGGLLVGQDPAGDPVAQAHRKEEAALLAEALLSLTAEQREVVLLRSEGRAWREIADLLQVPLPTASTRYRAALTRLRDACRSLSHA